MNEELNRKRKEDDNMKSNGRTNETTMTTNDDMKAQKFSENKQKHWIDALQCGSCRKNNSTTITVYISKIDPTEIRGKK